MTQRLDTSAIPSTTSTPSNDPLSSQLTEICKEKQVLQLRAQELEKMVEKGIVSTIILFVGVCF